MFFNKIALIGFLGSDAEARTTKNGASYTVLSLATKRSCHACDLAGEGNHRPGPIRVPHYWPYLVSTRSPRGKTRDLRCRTEEGRARSTGRGASHAGVREGVRQHPCHSERSEESPVKHRVCEISLESILKLDRAERQEEPAPDIEPTTIPPSGPFGASGTDPWGPFSPKHQRCPTLTMAYHSICDIIPLWTYEL